MRMFKISERLNEVLSKYDAGDLLDCYDEIYDGTCTTGYDNDGSTGYEIFRNGVTLGALAGDKPIFFYEDDVDNIGLFFIGEEEEILERVNQALEDENV
jgi:hypothetical protein